jgi:ABC-2 type transport system ATP-binding protein
VKPSRFATRAIETAGLTKSFGELPVLTGLDLRVAAGTVFALLGPNGAGQDDDGALLMMARLRHLRRRAARRRTAALLERFDLGAACDQRVATYSGGMKRRLELAMSLVSAPQGVVLDEPTTGLDPRSRRNVWDAVSELAASGATVLLTTQYLEEADRLADRIAVIGDGRIVAEGRADEPKARLGDETGSWRRCAG